MLLDILPRRIFFALGFAAACFFVSHFVYTTSRIRGISPVAVPETANRVHNPRPTGRASPTSSHWIKHFPRVTRQNCPVCDGKTVKVSWGLSYVQPVVADLPHYQKAPDTTIPTFDSLIDLSSVPGVNATTSELKTGKNPFVGPAGITFVGIFRTKKPRKRTQPGNSITLERENLGCTAVAGPLPDVVTCGKDGTLADIHMLWRDTECTVGKVRMHWVGGWKHGVCNNGRGPEDVRAFSMPNDEVYVLYSNNVCDSGVGISYSLFARRVYPGIGPAVRLPSPTFGVCEKNWVPFQHGGSLHVAQFVHPTHEVYKVDPPPFGKGNATLSRRWSTPGLSKLPGFRGGTNAVLWRGRYLAVGHYRIKQFRYASAAYTFEAKPPFRQLAVSDPFILWDDAYIEFAISLSATEPLTLWVGRNDNGARKAEIPGDVMEALLATSK
eukprot:m.97445 g.97445  ORF g.97445 m.97445 type:complete len:439 (+) comp12400_c0_seq1:237-1553(+)